MLCALHLLCTLHTLHRKMIPFPYLMHKSRSLTSCDRTVTLSLSVICAVCARGTGKMRYKIICAPNIVHVKINQSASERQYVIHSSAISKWNHVRLIVPSKLDSIVFFLLHTYAIYIYKMLLYTYTRTYVRICTLYILVSRTYWTPNTLFSLLLFFLLFLLVAAAAAAATVCIAVLCIVEY